MWCSSSAFSVDAGHAAPDAVPKEVVSTIERGGYSEKVAVKDDCLRVEVDNGCAICNNALDLQCWLLAK